VPDKKDLAILPTQSKKLIEFVDGKKDKREFMIACGIIILMAMTLGGVMIALTGPYHGTNIGLSIIEGIGVLATCFSATIIFLGIKGLRQLKVSQNNLSIKPNRFMSKYDIFAYTVALLSARVDKLIGRWNRHYKLLNAAYADPLLNEETMYESLRQLREETTRHIEAAETILEMEEEGDFVPQTTCDDSIAETLEHVRELEDQLRRSLNGIEHRLNSPLAVVANVAAMEAEMNRDMKDISSELERKRTAGRRLTVNS